MNDMTIKVDGIKYRFFDHLFAVSRCGKVLRKLTPYTPRDYRNDGYLTVGRHRLLHRMVATCWLEKPDGANQVHHKNKDKSANSSDNLEWVTPKIHMGERHIGCRGKPFWSQESRENMRIFRTGRKDSEETRRKKSNILELVSPKRPCEINGVRYRSIRAASVTLGIHISTARHRFLSKNFPGYKLG